MIDFKETRDLVRNSFYCSISTVDEDGVPNTTPVGSVYLTNENEGYFIEMFTTSFKNKAGKKASILAVNTSMFFWIRSIFKGQFKTPPATRIIITIGESRKITEAENARFQKRVKIFKGLKGHTKMWAKACIVRPFTIEKINNVKIGSMT